MKHAQLPAGAARFGGHPDLPDAIDWPAGKEGPLCFFAQFRLTDLAPLAAGRDLPSNGLLYFFYDNDSYASVVLSDDTSGWQVLYIDETAGPLRRREWPEGLSSDCRLPASRAVFSEADTLPEWDSQAIGGLGMAACIL
ncbi:DUF1963 domain-containing protein [Paenibacillus sp. y28]